MATIKLSDKLLSEARSYAETFKRSVPKQIEYWSQIGKIAEENPDLPYNLIKNILISKQELEDQKILAYEFG